MPTSQRYRLEPGAGMLTLSLPPVKHWQNILFCAAELLICLISSVKVLPYYLHTVQTFSANNGLFNLIWLLIWCLICFAALRRAAWLFVGAQVLQVRPGELGFQRQLFGLPISPWRRYTGADIERWHHDTETPPDDNRTPQLMVEWLTPIHTWLRFDYQGRLITLCQCLNEEEAIDISRTLQPYLPQARAVAEAT